MPTKISKSPDKTVPNQPPLRINENPPAKTLAAALANSKAQVEAAKK
jgi:hypothetical protein